MSLEHVGITGTISHSVVVYATPEGDLVFPCRCGGFHSGAYAQEDWNHCNCLHSGKLMFTFKPGEIPGDRGGQVMCPSCGKIWDVDPQTP